MTVRSCKVRPNRRGSAYLAVLATCLVVATLGLGGMLAARAQVRAARLDSDAEEARLCALSGIELARLWIRQDPQWRANRTSGVWATNLALGGGSCTIEAADPLDANLANRPHDPLTLKATGRKGNARHLVQVTLEAAPEPLAALRCALHTAGELHVAGGGRLTAIGATVSTNGSLNNESSIAAGVQAGSVARLGYVTGNVDVGGPAKGFPAAGVAEMYAKLGVGIAPGGVLQRVVLTPTYSPWGTASPEGVYVIRTTSNVQIRDLRLHGTLVVIAPGKKVSFAGNLLIEPYRPDYPAVVVQGDAEFVHSSDSALSESLLLTNFNPDKAPYQGTSDGDTSDEYPSEIRGLVHVIGAAALKGPALIRGALVCESAASTDAVRVEGASEIVYNPQLALNPPQGYAATVKMLPRSGSWRQAVDP